MIAGSLIGDEPICESARLRVVIHVVETKLARPSIRESEQGAPLERLASLDEEQRSQIDGSALDSLLNDEVQPPILDRKRGEQAATHPVCVVPAGVRPGASVAEGGREQLLGSNRPLVRASHPRGQTGRTPIVSHRVYA
ncbi:hypothetical protein [Haladaptatus sp. GCM10025707]|uniref:hypothetical protein n=1 Tax=Haladaptatus sp. GCM10025707 TaxID=3252658 RepID=UPI0036F37340